MILLESNLWGDLPTWIQAIVAIVAVILAVLSLFQTKKIKELTEVTSELSRQTEELGKQTLLISERNALEYLVTLPDRMLLFIREQYHSKYTPHAKIEIKNIGIDADIFALGSPDLPLFIDLNYNNNLVKRGQTILINVMAHKPFEYAHYSLVIYFADRVHQYFKQVISVDPSENKFIVHPPQAIVNMPDDIIQPIPPPMNSVW